ncbi:MAG: hypothetical protein R2789_08515 [Microthrixaceae bacterium]
MLDAIRDRAAFAQPQSQTGSDTGPGGAPEHTLPHQLRHDRRPAAPAVAPMGPGAGDVVEPLNRIRRMTGELMVASRPPRHM